MTTAIIINDSNSQLGAGSRSAPISMDSSAFSFLKNYPSQRLRILITGASGLVGSQLASFLKLAGHEIVVLKRGKGQVERGVVLWNPDINSAKKEDFENFDAVVHLAGKNIAGGPWTEKRKREIYSSRVDDTRFLVEIFSELKNPPKTFVCASAIGIYGSRGMERITEKSSLGSGFLAEVCKNWEKAASGSTGMRKIQTRFGLVLSTKGGMLQKILPLFRAGLGAVLGSGNQVVSWIALEDVIFALYHCLMTSTIEGPINFTSPHSETNRSFSQKLSSALRRPLLFRIGEKPLRWILGEMADELLLTSAHVIPEKLVASGYRFHFSTFEEFLKNLSH